MCKQRSIILSLLFLLCITMDAQETRNTSQTYFSEGGFSLRTNTLPWLMLVPNAGFEYKVSDNIGLIFDGAFARWSLETSNKYWNIWNIAPQARYYMGKLKDNYVGAQYTMGEYNLTGTQGNYLGGGLTFGHQFDCGYNLLVDLGLSIGYLYLKDIEEYTRKDGVNISTRDKYSHGYWGPTGASITFVWKIN